MKNPASTAPATPWHSLGIETVFERLAVTSSGLDEREVRERLARYGENVLPARKPPTLVEIFFRQFKIP